MRIPTVENGNTYAVPFSSVIELDPETKEPVWQYKGSPAYTFFSPHISGAQRLASGNTLICEGQWGRVFEVTPSGEIVWEYVSPFFDRTVLHFQQRVAEALAD